MIYLFATDVCVDVLSLEHVVLLQPVKMSSWLMVYVATVNSTGFQQNWQITWVMYVYCVCIALLYIGLTCILNGWTPNKLLIYS